MSISLAKPKRRSSKSNLAKTRARERRIWLRAQDLAYDEVGRLRRRGIALIHGGDIYTIARRIYGQLLAISNRRSKEAKQRLGGC